MARQIKPRQCLGRDHKTPTVVDGLEMADEAGGELAVAVESEPDLRRAGVGAERQVPRGAADRDVVFVENGRWW